MTQPDSSKEITLTIGELDVLVRAASMQAMADHVQQQRVAVEINKKIQEQLVQPSETKNN